jgi:hypothetical protein
MATTRELTPEAERHIVNFYKKPFFDVIGIFIIVFGANIIVWSYVGLGIYAGIGAVALVVGGLWFKTFAVRQKIKSAKEVYRFGDAVEISYVGTALNYGMKLNGVPQQVITIRKGDEEIQIKTFSHRVIHAFSKPAQQAYVLSAHPNIILPASLFAHSEHHHFHDEKKRSISM